MKVNISVGYDSFLVVDDRYTKIAAELSPEEIERVNKALVEWEAVQALLSSRLCDN
jgi:hypothetical protein